MNMPGDRELTRLSKHAQHKYESRSNLHGRHSGPSVFPNPTVRVYVYCDQFWVNYSPVFLSVIITTEHWVFAVKYIIFALRSVTLAMSDYLHYAAYTAVLRTPPPNVGYCTYL